MKLVEIKDPHAWMQAAVDKILDAGNRRELLKKGDKELIYLVQHAEKAGGLAFATAAKLRQYIDAWRAKQEVAEGRFDEPIDGWFVVKKDTDELVSKPFSSKNEAQKHLMTKLFANHHSYKVKKFGEVTESNKRLDILNDALAELVADENDVLSPAEVEKLLVRLTKKYKLLPNEVAALRDASEDAIGGPFEKYPVAEGEVISARFGAKGPLKDSGIPVPPGFDRFKLDGKHVFGLRDGKWLKISTVSDERGGKALVKAFNNGGMTDDDIKPISLMQAFGSEELAALDSVGVKLTEKPSNWADFEEGGQSEEHNIHEVKLKKVEKTIGKLSVINSADIYGGSLKPKGPMSSVRMMPDEQMFIVKFGDGTKYLVDRTGATSYIRFWQKII